MIRFDNVSKHFAGHVSALADVTVEIQDGEFVFLIGPSGAGKTTFLRLLIRDMLPTKGTVYVDDWNVTTLPTPSIYLLRRRVGTVFQDFKLLMDRTVYENVALGLEILGKSSKEIETRVMDVLELVGLADKRNSFPLQLSAGEMQRTGIARAIVGGPSILLADEPTGNLDPQISWDILDILKEIHKIGTTVIMATHNVTIVNDLKKRTIALEHGKMVSDEQKGRYHVPARSKGKKDHAGNS
ncbi:cell division ATP-binding protein FtsE [Candidatus Gottesmanbacteria bacterium RIFCSPLOWO2_01_FULL_46_9]|uniref:Cell division ATP-binding protein FtsE n=1 Tax=Candidatus Gottesmanbacteria bacterium RIFCSPLOWO2_01_FULL_46_9 TaxID=1798394 RepID=A0A1F6B3T1_9BACT|nr:MAG: cell division ATP-binding protein FtsE [Candidatus Gottesmanbacteria bacterium RIFCSPLOWO2_01_FULL_46_9]